jgi:hypothetical protein
VNELVDFKVHETIMGLGMDNIFTVPPINLTQRASYSLNWAVRYVVLPAEIYTERVVSRGRDLRGSMNDRDNLIWYLTTNSIPYEIDFLRGQINGINGEATNMDDVSIEKICEHMACYVGQINAIELQFVQDMFLLFCHDIPDEAICVWSNFTKSYKAVLPDEILEQQGMLSWPVAMLLESHNFIGNLRSQLNGTHGEATNTDDVLRQRLPETMRYVFTPAEESHFNEIQQRREVNNFPRFRLTNNIDKSHLLLDWDIFSSGVHDVIVQKVVDVINDPNTSSLALRFFSGDRQVYAWIPNPPLVREQLENVRATLMHSCSIGTNEKERNALAFMTRQKSELKYKLMKIEVPNDIFTLEDIAIESNNTWWSGVSKSLKKFFKSVVPPFVKFEEILVNLGDVQVNLELNALIQIVSNELQRYLVDGLVTGGKIIITANDLTGSLSFKKDCIVIEKQLVKADTGYTITQLMETETLVTNASDSKISGETTNKGVTMKRENENVMTTVVGRAPGGQGGARANVPPGGNNVTNKVGSLTSGTDAVVDRIDGRTVGNNDETKTKRSLQKMPIAAGTLMDSKVVKTLGVDAIGEKFYCKVGDRLFERVEVSNIPHSHVVQAWPCGTYSLWGNRLCAKIDLNTEGLRVIEVTGSEGCFSNRRDFVGLKETRKQIVDWCRGTLKLLTEMVLVEPGKAEVLEYPVSLGSIFPCKITWADIMPLIKVAAKHIEPNTSEVLAKALSIAESKLDESKLFDCTVLAKMMIDSAYYHLNKVSLQQVSVKHVVGK